MPLNKETKPLTAISLGSVINHYSINGYIEIFLAKLQYPKSSKQQKKKMLLNSNNDFFQM